MTGEARPAGLVKRADANYRELFRTLARVTADVSSAVGRAKRPVRKK